MNRRPTIIAAASLLSCSLLLNAAQDDHSATDWLLTLGPILFLLVIFFLMPRCMFKGVDRLTKRYDDHLDRVEAELKRIADALERRDK